MRLWHDDIRVPPDDSWTWARTNEEAQELLLKEDVSEIDLDHDLGLDHLDPETPNADYLRGEGDTTGVHLIEWMIANHRCPAKVNIHSWSTSGATAMATALADADCRVTIIPFDPACRD